MWPRGWVEAYLYSFMIAAQEGGEWSAARPGCTSPLGKTRYPFYRRLGGPQGRSWRAENLVPTGNQTTLRLLSGAATASTRLRVRELYFPTTYYLSSNAEILLFQLSFHDGKEETKILKGRDKANVFANHKKKVFLPLVLLCPMLTCAVSKISNSYSVLQ